jgi:hypothetical protein
MDLKQQQGLLALNFKKDNFQIIARSLKVHRSIKPNHNYLDTLTISEHVSIQKATLVQALRVPGIGGPRISRRSAPNGGNVSFMHWPSLPSRKHSWYSFLLEAESTTGP